MKIACFNRGHDGFNDADYPADNPRMTLDVFRQVYGGRAATNEEMSLARIRRIPEGHSVWRAADGRMLAIRDE